MTDFATFPSLSGKRVFITGGATGIGAALVRAFTGQGALVGFVDIAEAEGQSLAEQTGGWFRRVDVTDTAALKQAIAEFGEVDVLVNNVANDTRHDWRLVTQDSWDTAMAVNLRPAFFAIQAVAEGMMSRGSGSIINFGSISWKVKLGTLPAYTTAKSAIHGLTKSFVTELGASGVRINTVLPGWVMTERQKQEHWSEEGAKMLAVNQPLKGEIQPEDAAALVLFLAADDSRMCTGQDFTIDGGWT